MKLARLVERILAPLIVGTILGSFAALITADYLSQFGTGGHGRSQWFVWLQAAKALLLVAGGVVVVFGVIPAICEWQGRGDRERPGDDSSPP